MPFVVTEGVRVLGVYTTAERLFEFMPDDIELVCCRPPVVGWDSATERYREWRIRYVTHNEPLRSADGG
jgi:hypothetical protein